MPRPPHRPLANEETPCGHTPSAPFSRLLGLERFEFLPRLVRFLRLAETAIHVGQQVLRFGVAWVKCGRPLEPVHAQFGLAELLQRLRSDVEVARRIGVPVRCLRCRRECVLGIPGLQQQIRQVRISPVVLRVVLLGDLIGLQEIRSRFLRVAAGLPAEAQVVPSLVCADST